MKGGALARKEAPQVLAVEKVRAEIAKCKTIDEAREIADKAAAIGIYLRKSNAAAEILLDATEMRLWADSKVGEFSLALKKAEAGRPPKNQSSAGPISKKEVLEEAGITKQRANRCEKIALIPEEKKAEAVERARELVKAAGEAVSLTEVVRMASSTSGAADYDGDEWYTPPDVIAAVRAALGGIDLDPASNPYAQETVRARSFYTKKDNALVREWNGRVFCNPPYSMPLIQQFTDKLIAEYDGGRTTAAVYLVNNCTDAAWCQSLLRRFPVCFTAGRISFTNGSGQKFATRQGQAIFYLGDEPRRFAQAFDEIGTVLVVPQ